MKEVLKKNHASQRFGIFFFKAVFFILAVSGLGAAGFIMGGNITPRQDVANNFFIASITPENNSEISCGDTIEIKFSSSVKKQTIMSNNVFAFDLKKEKLINIGCKYNESLQTLFIKVPDSVLSDIQVELTDQVASEKGFLLAGGKRIFYTVKEVPQAAAPAGKKRNKNLSKITLRPNSIQKNRL